MKVIVAISRKMLVCAWHILKENVAYKDFDNKILTSDTKDDKIYHPYKG